VLLLEVPAGQPHSTSCSSESLLTKRKSFDICLSFKFCLSEFCSQRGRVLMLHCVHSLVLP